MATTKADKIIDGLSDGARQALAEARGTHQGAAVGGESERTTRYLTAMAELEMLGLIGRGNGLTMLGSIVAGRMRAQLEEEMFG